jgi:hypothetical protein
MGKRESGRENHDNLPVLEHRSDFMRDCVTNENMSLHQIFENEVYLEVFNRHKWEK